MQETIQRLLELGNYGPDNVVELTWPELISTDPLEEAQTLTADKALGIVSQATLAAKRGYDWETEKANIEQERQDAQDAMGSIGEGVQNDAGGAGAGMVPAR